MGSDIGLLAENRKFLVDETQLAILIEQLLYGGVHLLAIRAAVIEELDDSDIALRVAAHRCRRVVEDLVATIAKHLRRLDVGLAVRLGFRLAQRVDQHIGVLHQVIVNDLLDCLALFGCNLRGSEWTGRYDGKTCASQGKNNNVSSHGRSRVRLIEIRIEAFSQSSLSPACRWIFSARL